MAEISTDFARLTWKPDQCPFSVEYSPRVLDDIRLAVVDAFFSLPRGGAEIGGILLGGHTAGTVTITDYLPLECEHAFGPSFMLSPRDQSRLAELIASVPERGLEVVGWYHSHTRTGIFLNEADLDVNNRYFRDPWQVALVMKPHTFEPARCGFFFREADGSVHSAESYQEFSLDQIVARPLPVMPDVTPEPSQPKRWQRPSNGGSHSLDEMRASRRPLLTVDAVVQSISDGEPVGPGPEWTRRPMAEAHSSMATAAPAVVLEPEVQPQVEVVAPMPAVEPGAQLRMELVESVTAPVVEPEALPQVEVAEAMPTPEVAPEAQVQVEAVENEPALMSEPEAQPEVEVAEAMPVLVVEPEAQANAVEPEAQPQAEVAEALPVLVVESAAQADAVEPEAQPEMEVAETIPALVVEPAAQADAVEPEAQPEMEVAETIPVLVVEPAAQADAVEPEAQPEVEVAEALPVLVVEPEAQADAVEPEAQPEVEVAEALPVLVVEPEAQANAVEPEAQPEVEVAEAIPTPVVEPEAQPQAEAVETEIVPVSEPETSSALVFEPEEHPYPETHVMAPFLVPKPEPQPEPEAVEAAPAPVFEPEAEPQTGDSPATPTLAFAPEQRQEPEAIAMVPFLVPEPETQPRAEAAGALPTLMFEPEPAPALVLSPESRSQLDATESYPSLVFQPEARQYTSSVPVPPPPPPELNFPSLTNGHETQSMASVTEEPPIELNYPWLTKEPEAPAQPGGTIAEPEIAMTHVLAPVEPDAHKPDPIEETPAPASVPVDGSAPDFEAAQPKPRSLAWLYWLVAASLVATVSYVTRDRWLQLPGGPAPVSVAAVPATAPHAPAASKTVPAESHAPQVPATPPAVPPTQAATPAAPPAAVPAATTPAPSAPAGSLSLQAAEVDGQFLVRWNRDFAAVRDAKQATLEITDGGAKRSIPLTAAQLKAGSLSYPRRSERVDVRLNVNLGKGAATQDLTSFAGPLPPKLDKKAAPADPAVRKQRDALALEVTRLRSELAAQTQKNQKLERSVTDLKKQVQRNMQLRRLSNQSGLPQQ